MYKKKLILVVTILLSTICITSAKGCGDDKNLYPILINYYGTTITEKVDKKELEEIEDTIKRVSKYPCPTEDKEDIIKLNCDKSYKITKDVANGLKDFSQFKEKLENAEKMRYLGIYLGLTVSVAVLVAFLMVVTGIKIS